MEDATARLMERVKREIEAMLLSDSFYIEARTHVLNRLMDRSFHLTKELVDSFEPDRNGQQLTFEQGSDPNVSDLVLSLARRVAAMEAIGLLYADGIIVQVNSRDTPNGNDSTGGGSDALHLNFRISWTNRGGSSSGNGFLFMPLPKFPGRVRLARAMKPNGTTLDFMTFSTDLAPLDLDQRTLRALEQAFQTFRRGLYLATAVLCGTVVEGAVRTSVSRLAPLTSADSRRKPSSQQLRPLVKYLIQVLGSSSKKQLPTRADQLSSHINRFIDLRNYGAHTGEPDAGLERWFEDDLMGAMLLADVRHTLLMLKETIDDRLAVSR